MSAKEVPVNLWVSSRLALSRPMLPCCHAAAMLTSALITVRALRGCPCSLFFSVRSGDTGAELVELTNVHSSPTRLVIRVILSFVFARFLFFVVPAKSRARGVSLN